MKIIATAANKLAKYAPAVESAKWQLVHSGYWSQSRWHNGHIAYYSTCLPDNTWVMKSVERNTMLDDVTEEDVEEGNLNDDQIQAMWGMTLEEAQNEVYEEIVVVCTGAPVGVDVARIARRMYATLMTADGAKQVEEPDDECGLADQLDFDIDIDDVADDDNGCLGDEESIEYEVIEPY